MKKRLLSVLFLLAIFVGVRAQTNIANYKFVSSSGTYVPLAAGASTFIAATYDNNVSNELPLGGNFVYGATTYTSCYVSSNGFISFGGVPSTSAYTPLSTLGSMTGVISAYAQDGSQSSASGAVPAITYANVGGTSGEFIVQFADHANFYNNTTERLNFQIRLNLSTGAINIVYGSWTTAGTSTSGNVVQVGLRGSSITYSNNVNSLMSANIPSATTCSWANAVTSFSSTSTMLFGPANLAVMPSNGLTLTWTPPVNPTLAPVRFFSAVTGITQTSANLSWTAPTSATQYNVQYRIPGVSNCAWTNFSGNPVSTNSVSLTGLTINTNYQVRVQATDGTNTTIWSHIPDAAGTGDGYTTTGTFKTLPPFCTVPTAQPTNLVFGTATSTSVSATFAAASPTVSNYLVVRTLGAAPTSPVDGTTYTSGTAALGGTIVSIGTTTTISSTGLTGNTNYSYFVYAYNTGTCAPIYLATAPLNGTVTTCVAAPGTATVSNNSQNSFVLTWGSSVGGGANPVTYTLDVSTNSTVATPIVGSPFVVTAPSNSVSITGLTDNTRYYYRIMASNGCNSAYTTTANITTLTLPCVAPTAQPTGLMLSSTATAVNGTFTAASPASTNYLVVRTLGAVPSAPVNNTTYTVATAALGGTIVAVGTATTFANTGLASNTNYSYFIYAYNTGTCAPVYLATAPLTGSIVTCVSAPGTATISNTAQTSFDIAWGSSVGGGANPVTYTVDVATNNTFAAPVTGSPFVISAPSTSVSITGLTAGTQYFYRTIASNGCNSAYTTTASVTTLNLPCVAPTAQATGLNLSSTATAVNGTFTAVTSTLTSYLVVRTTGAIPTSPATGTVYVSGTAALGGTIAAVGTSTTFANTGLTGNTNYSYFVFTYNNTGCVGGPVYNTASPLTGSIVTCVSAPGTGTVSGTTQTAFNLTFGSSVGGGANPVTYTVDVATNNTFATPVAGSPFVITAPTNSIAVSGLTAGTQYFYRMIASNGCNSAYTSTATVTTISLPCVAPTAQATGLNLSSTATAVNGTFTAVTSTLTSYLVVRTTGAIPTSPATGTVYVSGTAALGGTIAAVGTSTTFANTGLTGNTNYSYFVFTYNNTGCTGGPIYNTASPLTGSIVTCVSAPGTGTVSGITQTAFNLAFGSSVGGGANPVTYTVDVATNNTFATPVAGSPFVVTAPSTSVSITGLTAGTQYFYRMIASNGCMSAYTATGTVNTNCTSTNVPYLQDFESVTTPDIPLCTAVENVGSGNIWTTNSPAGYGFNSKTLRYVYNSGNAANTWFYTRGLNLTAGQSYRLTYRYGAAGFTEKMRINYGTSPLSTAMTNTLVDHSNITGSTALSNTIDFIPATTGVYYIGFNAYSDANKFYLFVDDIFVDFTPTCFPPTGLIASGITTSASTFSWTAPALGTPANYIYEVRTSGAAGSGATGLATTGTVVVPTNSVTVSGLLSGTTYTAYFRSDCGGGDLSAWTSTVLTTVCSPVTILPFIEDFETAVSPAVPNCWTVIDGNSDGDKWITYNDVTYSHSGTKSVGLYTDFNAGANNDWLITPQIVLTGNQQLKYWVRARSSSEPNDYTVKLSPTGSTLPASFTNTLLALTSVSNTAYAEKIISLSGITGTVTLAFHVPAGGLDGYYLYIDDVLIENIPTCYPPTALTATNATISNVDLSWTTPTVGTPANYIYEIRTSGAAGSGATGLVSTGTVVVPTNSVTATGLTATTGYSVYVRSDCGAGDLSAWSTVKTFTTPAACPTPINLTISNVLGHRAVATWTAGATETVWDVYYGSAPLTPPTAGTVPTVTTTATSYTITGLNAVTGYSVYVRADCGAGSYSAWTAVKAFTTTVSCPAPTNVTIATTPTTAVATWTAGGLEPSWFVKYSAPTTTATVSSPSYSLTGLTPSTTYSIQVRGYCGVADTSTWTVIKTFMTPCLPPNITSTIPGTRCGIGTTTLAATADAGATIQWYTTPTGGSAVATGSLFTTPSINATTNYYVSATSGATNLFLGPVSPTAEGGTISSSSVDWQMNFDVIQNTTLASVDIFPTAAVGSVGSIKITTLADVLVSNITYTTTVTGGNVQTVSLNVPLTPGTGYKIRQGTAIALNRNTSAAAYPYTSPSINITGNGFDQTYYYYFYNWSVASGCESARTSVVANVNTPPSLSLTTATTVCANVVSTLSVTSTLSNYTSYIWSPTTNLYTDAAATTAYTGGTATTVYYKTAVGGSTTYSVNASNSGSGCANIATTTMSTQVISITASATPTMVCSGNPVTLNGYFGAPGLAAVGTGTTTTSTVGVTPYSSNYEGSREQYLITAAELHAANLNAGNLTSLSFSVTALGAGTNAQNNFSIKLAHTANTSLSSAYGTPTGAFTTVYGPVSQALPSLGANMYTFATPFNWDGVSNILVDVCHDNDPTGTCSLCYSSNSTVASSITSFNSVWGSYADNAQSCGVQAANTISTYNNRPLMLFGGAIVNPASSSLSWQWNPGAINSNTAVVTPVNAGSTPTVNSYTLTGTDPATSCSSSAIVSVTVNPLPSTPIAVNSTQCGLAIPTASVTGGTAYKWYATSTSTTVLQSGASSTYTAAINATTTWYVSSFNGTCESTRAMLTASVTAPDAVTASATQTAVCPGQTFSLTATKAGSTNTYTYTWISSPVAGSGIPTSVNGGTVAVAGTIPGTYNYMVTAMDAACTTTAAVNVTIVAPPAISVSSSPTLACSGSSITLTGASYATGSSVVPTGYCTPSSSGSGCLTQVSINTLNRTSVCETSYYIDVPTATASTNLTPGQSYVLNLATNSTAITSVWFDWNRNGTFDASEWTQIYTNATSGSVTITVPLTATQGLTKMRVRSRLNGNANGSGDACTSFASGEAEDYTINVLNNISSSYTWQWNPGAVNSNTAIVVPTTGSTPSAYSYTVTATDPVTTCSNTAVLTLTVNPSVTVTAVSSSSAICSGNSVSLTATGATTYTWMPAGGSASTATVIPSATTVYTVTGTSLGCSNTKTVSVNVTVTPTVIASASPTVICAGATVSLTATGATNYTWTPGAIMTASATVTPTSTTVYSITGANGSCVNTKTVNVVVNNVPVVNLNPSTTICTTGGSATLTATGTSTAYAWSNGATTATNVVTPTAPTSYTVTGTNSCGSTTATTSVVFGSAPTVSASTSAPTICNNNSAVLTVSGTATNYTWNTGATSLSITVTPTITTLYIVTGSNACGTASATVIQNVDPCTSLEEMFNSDAVSIYPNPAHDFITIAIPASLTTNTTLVEVTDAIGKLVMKETLNTDITTINLNKLEDGVYFFKVISNNQAVKVGKIVKH